MSFIQCKNENEVEEKLKTVKAGFVTEDFRIYDEINFSDDCSYYELNAEVIMALYDLQSSIQMVIGGMHEMPFQNVVRDAQMLDTSFKKALELIKFKPLKRFEE